MNVFITGASSGLGAELARQYGAAGARLGLAGRRAEALAQTASGLDALTYVADVRDPTAMRDAAHDYLARVGVPDVVIGAAGISVGALTELEEDVPVFQAQLDANVMGLVHTFAPFVPPMIAAGRGTLCGIASVAGVRGLPGGGAYSASKAAARVYLEALRLELKPRGVTVVTVSPGYIDTPMTRVNPYPMPFKMSVATAANKVVRAIQKGSRHAVIPWQMAWVSALLTGLPDPVYDALFKNAPRKPRGLKI